MFDVIDGFVEAEEGKALALGDLRNPNSDEFYLTMEAFLIAREIKDPKSYVAEAEVTGNENELPITLEPAPLLSERELVPLAP